MYRFNAEDPGQSLYTPTTVGVILKISHYTFELKQTSYLCMLLLLPTLKGCEKVGRAMNLPPTAVLCGYIVLGSFVLSPSLIKVPGTDWTEPVFA